ncbi:tRNA (adenosine(37)-N6)-threonylcarbamoyltransferase complex transferase subunit TsaD [Rickettsia endosymbiont of Cardiosporidium cionae]|uniref:tRNA (adenosine(37)-N6)-threonylcarbamoyltransferase complex transferase subunit TsaD n=1 Tax=Rickettsia endosymbiont of Cardiosporidium cionae TaxID=2777155 RepID=UPI001894D7A4|nr:tRNA (adenosine(37)-N6)-threonylcarbamoyltransferase complex transferase subunit TsaD [Rickettsia endosymbiont of Cardiosporidium cionae]KAF8818855.1 tRNA (adenosine(37)-N6)-threonylcarbamoyltransferase complex transferase subunit TsaD [Rickettsia endosymbiont of Cardiosporidium cionae]
MIQYGKKILGIESSCDDSAAAIIDSNFGILSNIVISQNAAHQPFDGVVPEIASRYHVDNLELAIKTACTEANITLKDIDAISVTAGPGLIGGVIVGSMFAKGLASVLKKPIIAINHLEGHALTVRLSDNTEYPYLLLLISGGHCQFISVNRLSDYRIIGQTLDDALGEAFDKVAKMLRLPFPGGPQIEEYAKLGDENRFTFPKPMIKIKNADMSFSGLKTAVHVTIKKIQNLSLQDSYDIAASFQKIATDVLLSKTFIAMKFFEQQKKVNNSLDKQFVISGGVAANSYIRSKLCNLASDLKYKFIAPPIKLCTDNAAMIAQAGLERLKSGLVSNINFRPKSRWSIEEC